MQATLQALKEEDCHAEQAREASAASCPKTLVI